MRKAFFVAIMVVAIFSVAAFTPLTTAWASSETSYMKAMRFKGTPLKFDETKVPPEPEAPPSAPLAGKKWAVVIGIADYQGTGNDLWHPDEDAKEMYTELVRQQGYPKSNVKLLTNKAATAAAIVNAINWLITNEKAGDEVVFFYSGHGYRAPDSKGWDSDVETDGNDEMIVTYDFYGLPDGWFKGKFTIIESTKFTLMFGSCHSGGMFDDNDDLQGTGRIIASACKADQYGWDYLLLGNTLWGYYFVDEGLIDNRASSVEAAHEYAYPRVVALQSDSQPQLYDNFPDDFIL